MAGLSGEFTIHSRVYGESIRTKIDAVVDYDGNGKFGDDEVLFSSGKEGYRVRNAITDFTSEDYMDALKLRQIKKSGQFSFDIEPFTNSLYELIGGDILFKNSNQKKAANLPLISLPTILTILLSAENYCQDLQLLNVKK